MIRTRHERPFIRRLNKIKRIALEISSRAILAPKDPHGVDTPRDLQDWLDTITTGLIMGALSTLRKRTIKQAGGQEKWEFIQGLLNNSVSIRSILNRFNDMMYHPKYGNKIVTVVNGKTVSIEPKERPLEV